MLTGGAEMATTPLGIAGFNAAKALQLIMIFQWRQVDLGIKTEMALFGRRCWVPTS